MSDISEKILQLQARLDKMVEYQNYFHRETDLIRQELNRLKKYAAPLTPDTLKPEAAAPPTSPQQTTPPSQPREPVFPKAAAPQNNQPPIQPPIFNQRENQAAANKSGIEEFVGKNLFSLIGIVITILGVGIFAKWAIDRDLISPTARILLGYAFAAGLFGIAVWLKKRFLNFSAVLMSGALATMYFLTFFAYAAYALLPQTIAFAMMVGITAFTIAAAINYNRQVIAHIGLVGAYAVPFLLSENSGRADILFGYMAIINIGILIISIKKFWKSLYYSSFVFTWLIYAAWFASSYRAEEHFFFAFGFAAVFFLTFYLTFLSYKLLAKEEFNAEIIVLVLVNSFVFYGFGYAIINSRDNLEPYLGLFTLANAALNALVAFVIHQYKLGDRKNVYLAIALAICFVTIAVPVQFEGSWVTLIWTAEAVALFYFGRTKQLAVYENLSYALMILASASLLIDWQWAFRSEEIIAPIFNQNFLTTALFAAAFGFLVFQNRDERYPMPDKNIGNFLHFLLPMIFLVALYNLFRVEIANYFHAQIVGTAYELFPATETSLAQIRRDTSLVRFNFLWQMNYSMLFLAALASVNIKHIKSGALAFVNLALNTLVLFVFLAAGFYFLGDLRTSYILPIEGEVFARDVWHILIRYVSLVFVAFLIWSSWQTVKQNFLREKFPDFNFDIIFDFVFHAALLWILSSELINLTEIFGYRDSYKLGLSILWGIYSLLLIVLGIVKRKAYLRFGAIALFAITLIKLFFYDIAELDTISKTVVFISLGILLLIISFLYNKYKDVIFESGKK